MGFSLGPLENLLPLSLKFSVFNSKMKTTLSALPFSHPPSVAGKSCRDMLIKAFE